MKSIPYGRQDVNQADIEAVIEVLRSDWLTQGPTLERFEQKVAEYCGAKYAVAVNSATSALHIACMAAGLGLNDILWTSPNTFVASANCGRYCGAVVDFVDIDFRTYNMSVEKLEQKLALAKEQHKLPKVVIPVHFSGQSCEMDRISILAKEYGFTVIEDASHAIGSRYKGQEVGCGAYSDMTIFSFHPVKIVTTAEGGMVLTNKQELYERLIQFRSHGITRKQELMTEEAHGSWYYQQLDLGYNYRMTDIQAALGLSQMDRLDEFVMRRQGIAEKYNEKLQGLPIVLPWQHPDTYSAYHLYVICLEEDKITKTHKRVFEELRQAGIGVNLHYIPVHTQPYYRELGFDWGDFPVSEYYYQTAISIPMYSAMTDADQDYVIKTLKEVLL
ncbi:UDP-4-amino-4,6-dideoxy-N-acetyl-beta-L-altrosamine transaminase [Pelosinus fermentans]|uniref:UDP-4-amino-4, 6-dideoxy-N-acetyl-beta-L-altrosamine transaminase n=1 Tax=Pelosinus fermentans TaxID=365349 RepID=UPI0002685EAB|nr:UDP-4-amino-4,6-dideoxy-N-acetyl-beta-L-altrosamine transaminase [Pelosinus fermentans]OAM92854.1 UDP-4-keto-6-deoxy-N-acetylglucosamine 4-aminotransferase [Pelosinus fermentans DSM 17108]SDQ58988.1 UDP-4-amino-4,6-dideoxy-N-acetyl-beta-L-altrosamine transaminase [Pelosinus fermentans]